MRIDLVWQAVAPDRPTVEKTNAGEAMAMGMVD
jgi:hypothetical protein